MSELERIQSDLEKGYTVTRYGTTKALHKQMLDDIKYLNDIAKHNEVLGDVSNSFKLEYCCYCLQMTNHVDNKCKKCDCC